MSMKSLIKWKNQINSYGVGKWKEVDKAGVKLEHESISLACASALVQTRIYREIVDFDNHLDDISQVISSCRFVKSFFFHFYICNFIVCAISLYLSWKMKKTKIMLRNLKQKFSYFDSFNFNWIFSVNSSSQLVTIYICHYSSFFLYHETWIVLYIIYLYIYLYIHINNIMRFDKTSFFFVYFYFLYLIFLYISTFYTLFQKASRP